MHELAHEPRTVHQVAESLGVPFTRLYYHIKMLEKHNLVRVVDVGAAGRGHRRKVLSGYGASIQHCRNLADLQSRAGKNDSLEYMLDGVFGASHRDMRISVADWPQIDLKRHAARIPESLLARKFLLRLTDEQADGLSARPGRTCCSSISLARRQLDDDPYYSCLIALYRSSVPFETFDDSGCIETE